jgi:hypothetical protein
MDMNEGTLAILIQWCFLCLVWMGSFDRPLKRWGVSRAGTLAVLAAFLACSFVSWQITFLPVQVSLSGAILPLLCGGWLYGRLAKEKRRLYLLAGAAAGLALFWLRWLFFTDPVLQVWDEAVLLPTAAVLAVFAIARRGLARLYLLAVSLPGADVLYALYVWKLSGTCEIGGGYAQDLLWSAVSLWSLTGSTLAAVRRLFGYRETETSHSDTHR